MAGEFQTAAERQVDQGGPDIGDDDATERRQGATFAGE
jgi:hypothetical protein